MKNYKCSGKTKTFTAAADYSSGDVVVIGDLVGIVAADVVTGARGEASVEGVFEVPKKAADDLTDGLKVYWDATNSEATLTASTHKVIGYVYEPAGAAVTSVEVKLGR
jgi:predicted RecA/RadA family phage recombinase